VDWFKTARENGPLAAIGLPAITMKWLRAAYHNIHSTTSSAHTGFWLEGQTNLSGLTETST